MERSGGNPRYDDIVKNEAINAVFFEVAGKFVATQLHFL